MNSRFTVLSVGLILASVCVDSAAAQERRVRRGESSSGKASSSGSIRGGERSARSAPSRGVRSSGGRVETRTVETRKTASRNSTVVVSQRPRGARVVRREPRYYRPVTRGTVIAALPHEHTTVVVHERPYHCYDGVFYVADARPNHYVVVPPPVGVQVEAIPTNSIAIQIGGFSFYYADDTWYDESLTVVDVPVGGYVYTLPPAYETVVVRDVTYYRAGECYYRPHIHEGRTAYMRVDLRF